MGNEGGGPPRHGFVYVPGPLLKQGLRPDTGYAFLQLVTALARMHVGTVIDAPAG